MINRAQHIASLISEGIFGNLKKRYQDNYKKYLELEKNYYTDQRSKYLGAPPPKPSSPSTLLPYNMASGGYNSPPKNVHIDPPPGLHTNPSVSSSPNWTSPNPGLHGNPSRDNPPPPSSQASHSSNWTSPGGHSSSGKSSGGHSSSYESPRSKQQQQPHSGPTLPPQFHGVRDALLSQGFMQHNFLNPYLFVHPKTGIIVDLRQRPTPAQEKIQREMARREKEDFERHWQGVTSRMEREHERETRDINRQERQMDRERSNSERNMASWGREFDRETRAFQASLED